MTDLRDKAVGLNKELTGIRIMGITSSPSGGLYKHWLFFFLSMCNFNSSKVNCSIQLFNKQPLLCNHMPVSYSNTIARLLGILPSHQQCDCLCRHCACLCYRRKGTTRGQPRNALVAALSKRNSKSCDLTTFRLTGHMTQLPLPQQCASCNKQC